MAALVFMVMLLAMAGHSSATWCICKDGSDTALQKTLDYACGAGADCSPTHKGGACYNPDTVRAHCSYAVNSYFQKYKQQPQACDFSGTAMIVTSDPSVTGCSYPSSASGATSTTTSGGTTSSGGTTTTVNGGSPVITTPSGVLGGNNNGLGPAGMNNDFSRGWALSPTSTLILSSIVLTLPALVLW